MTRHVRAPLIVGLSTLLALTGVSCSSGPKNFDNENDDLRRRVDDLEAEVVRLRGERDEALANVAEMSRALEREGSQLTADVRQAIPRCVRLELGRLTGPTHSGDSAGFDVVDVYVTPRDARGRFVQIVGDLIVRADLLPEGTDPARQLGSAVLSAPELREAYRAGITGTHYTIRIPLTEPIRPGDGAVAIGVEFVDALTGKIVTVRGVVETPGEAQSQLGDAAGR